MIKAVIADWAGTMVDYGCFAPLRVFVEVFRQKGVAITDEEARRPMGLLKRDHIQAICRMERVAGALEQEGGVAARAARYADNQARLTEGMERLGFRSLLPRQHQSPIITAFYEPDSAAFTFGGFYDRLKQAGFVIYPGKLTNESTFRIGNIGDVHAADIDRLLEAVKANRFW